MDELEAPPNKEVMWLAARADEMAACAVKAQTWVIARAKAAAALGCEPGQVNVERMVDYGRI